MGEVAEGGGEEGCRHEAKRRLQELAFGTFSVPTTAFEGIIRRGHIDVLMRNCAAKDCDIIELQESERDRIFFFLAAGYCVVIATRSKEGNGNVESGRRFKKKSLKRLVRTESQSSASVYA